MKSIVLSSRIKLDKFNKINFLIDEDLSNFINQLDANILPISFKKKNKINYKNLSNATGLILSGGGDIYHYKKTKENKIQSKTTKDNEMKQATIKANETKWKKMKENESKQIEWKKLKEHERQMKETQRRWKEAKEH